MLAGWLADPASGPAAGALAVLPDRELATRLARDRVAVAIVASLAELAGRGSPVLPWSAAAGGSVGSLVVLAPDGVAVLDAGDLRCAPVEAGAFETPGGTSVALAPGARPRTWALSSDAAFAARGTARLCAGAVLVGVAQAALEDVIDYGRRRIVFGQPVLGHQANAFDLAGHATAVEAARRALARAARRDTEATFGWAATQAYLEARQAAVAATDLAVQLHGGHGYLQGTHTERYFRESRMLSLLWGGADAALDDLTDRALEAPEWTWP